MKSNREKLMDLVDVEKTKSFSDLKENILNRSRLRDSQEIALKLLTKIDELDWSIEVLSGEVGISVGELERIVRGKEIIPLCYLMKLGKIL